MGESYLNIKQGTFTFFLVFEIYSVCEVQHIDSSDVGSEAIKLVCKV